MNIFFTSPPSKTKKKQNLKQPKITSCSLKKQGKVICTKIHFNKTHWHDKHAPHTHTCSDRPPYAPHNSPTTVFSTFSSCPWSSACPSCPFCPGRRVFWTLPRRWYSCRTCCRPGSASAWRGCLCRAWLSRSRHRIVLKPRETTSYNGETKGLPSYHSSINLRSGVMLCLCNVWKLILFLICTVCRLIGGTEPVTDIITKKKHPSLSDPSFVRDIRHFLISTTNPPSHFLVSYLPPTTEIN